MSHRSLVERVISSLKRRYSSAVKSRVWWRQFREMVAVCLVYNLERAVKLGMALLDRLQVLCYTSFNGGFLQSQIFLLSLTLLFAFGMVLAQETSPTETTKTVNLDENIQPEDLEIKEPKLLPDSPFYKLPYFKMSLPDQILAEDTSLDNTIDLWEYAEDNYTSDDKLKFSITNNPPQGLGITIDGNRYIDIKPTKDWNGQTEVTIEVKDEEGKSTKDTFIVFVSPVNDPPELDLIGDKEVNEGNLLEFKITASDPDKDPLTYSASNLPKGASFNPKTQIFSWRPTSDQVGIYKNVYFEVRDGRDFGKNREDRGIMQAIRINKPIDANIENPYLSGARISVLWSQIQPKEEIFDWTKLDEKMAPWIAAGKKVRIQIPVSAYAKWHHSLRSGTPKWVFDKGARYLQRNFKDKKITLPPEWDDRKDTTTYPVIWDPIFREEYETFIREVGKRYSDNPNIAYIQIGLFPEMNLGDSDDSLALEEYWIKEGFTLSRYEESVKWFIDLNIEVFNPIPCTIALNSPKLKIAKPSERMALIERIAGYLAERGGWLQNNGFSASYPYDWVIQPLFRKYHKTTGIVFHQLWPVSVRPEETGDFRTAIENALTAHPDYLEIWSEDISLTDPDHPDYNKDWEEALRFAAEHVGIEPDEANDVWIRLTDHYRPKKGQDPEPGHPVTSGNDYYQGLYQVNVSDGGTPSLKFIKDIEEKRSCRKTDESTGNNYIYFQVDPGFINGGTNSVEIKVTYLDSGTDTFSLEYDSVTEVYKNGGTITKTNTNQWLTTTFIISDAQFAKRQPGGTTINEAPSTKEPRKVDGTDFRINSNWDGDECINFVQVIKEKVSLSDSEKITITVHKR